MFQYFREEKNSEALKNYEVLNQNRQKVIYKI